MSFRLISLFLVFLSINSALAADQKDYLSQLDKRYPYEKGKSGGPKFFNVPVVQKALVTSVPRGWRLAMMDELVVETPNKLVDGYLVASGCKPHFCPDKYYAAAVRVTDGAALFIVFDDKLGQIKDATTQCFSAKFDSVSRLPKAVQRELMERNALDSIDDSPLGCAVGRR